MELTDLTAQNDSNGYQWNWERVLSSVIESRGTSQVVFINGMNVADIDTHATAVREAFNVDTDESFPHLYDSLSFRNYENISESNGKEAGEDFGTFHAVVIPHLFQFAIDNFERQYSGLVDDYQSWWWNRFNWWNNVPPPNYTEYGLTKQTFESVYEGYKIAKEIVADPDFNIFTKSLPRIFALRDVGRRNLSNFLGESGDLENFGSRVGAEPQSDFAEALIQFLYDEPQAVSQEIIDRWNDDSLKASLTSNGAEGDKNSVIFVAHSQGNFFVEDILNQDPTLSAYDDSIRIVSLGSPTNYRSVSDLEPENIALFPDGEDDPNAQDPITDLRFDNIDNLTGRAYHAFTALNAVNLALNLKYHDLTPDTENGYLGRPDVKEKFADFFDELHPSGYYFPDGIIEANLDNNSSRDVLGTEKGDWIGGSDGIDILSPQQGNDVVRGMGESDVFIASSGYDFFDGGAGDDVANYENATDSIAVSVKTLGDAEATPADYSVYYQVDKADGELDILVDIEAIRGSQFSDNMYGGDGSDIFFGNEDFDSLFGYAGNDILHGEGGDDIIFGGVGDDTLMGNEGNNTLYADDGDDLLYGGTDSGVDTFVIGSGMDTIFNFDVGQDILAFAGEFDLEDLLFIPLGGGQNSDAATQDYSVQSLSTGEQFAVLKDVQLQLGETIEAIARPLDSILSAIAL